MSGLMTLQAILKDAAREAYGIGSFSPRYTRMILPVVQAAMELHSPLIIQISEKEIIRHKVSLSDFSNEFYRIVDELAPQVPMVLHLDHTKTMDVIREAIDCKFTSVMIDASEYEFNENVKISREVTEYAHARGVSVEAELGRIGTTDFAETDTDVEHFTNPDEAKLFVEQTQVDALAVSVGTAHGVYTLRKPAIQYDLLRTLNQMLAIPLVLHGGSDVPADMVVKAVQLETGGVAKVNIATDLELAMLKALGESTHITDEALNAYGPEQLEAARYAVKQVVREKITHYLLSANKAW